MGGEAVETNYSHVLQAEVGRIPQPGVLLRTVHAIYHAQFGRWFGIMAPTSLLAGLVLVLAAQQIKAINSAIPRGEVLLHKGDILVMGAVRYGQLFLVLVPGLFRAGSYCDRCE